MRIVSLVPSLTELVCALGYTDKVVGCTSFCVYPKGLHKSAQIVGGTKDPDLAAIAGLAPSHILVNSEENKPEHIQACQQIAPTYETFPKSPYEVPALFRRIGDFLEGNRRAEEMAVEVEASLEEIAKIPQQRFQGKRYLYYIWKNPWMVASEDTYIASMLALLGLQNAAPTHTRYPELPVPEAKNCAPDLIFLSSEPWPFRVRDYKALEAAWEQPLPPTFWIDGRLMSWYGFATLEALREMKKWLNLEETALIKQLPKAD